MGLYRWIVEGIIALAVAACGVMAAAFDGGMPAHALPLRPCHLDGIAEAVRCGTLAVFEDRERATGRRIAIHVAVVPALVRDPQPDPLVLLAGGPGQGARSYASLVPRFFQRVRRERDIVLVDLRGTGDSAPLKCPIPQGAAAFTALTEAPDESTRRCLEGLDADPRFYTHLSALADLKEVLDRLAYRQVNLWGGSWGTRSALAFAARYPGFVRTVTLDGAVAVAMDFPWSYPHDAARALDRLFADCAADRACAQAFPDPSREIDEWLTALERQPFTGVVGHPRTGEQTTIRLDRAAAAEIIRAALYAPPDAGRILLAVHRAAAGDVAALVTLAERAAGWSLDTMAIGQTLAILCSEDVGRTTPSVPMRHTILGSSAVDAWIARCRDWPKGPALTIDAQTVLAIPALILSGELDPVTPPARGEAMRHHFPDSLHVVVPGGGHNVSFSGCVPRLIAEFIDRAGWRALDPSCAKDVVRPPFATAMTGAQP